ncbi:MAG: hypothetical protein ACI8WB_003091 [Phenylobacterium sp.]|jgi:hypothetical protein
MKKLLLLILAFAILSAVDHPVINQFYDDTIGQIKMLARDSAKTGTDAGAGYVYRDMKSKLAGYSEAENKAIVKITKSNASVLKFQKDYCISKDFNPVLFGAHMQEFCLVIAKHESTLQLVEK